MRLRIPNGSILMFGLALLGLLAARPLRALPAPGIITFAPYVQYAMPDGQGITNSADLDGDGKLDILVAGATHVQVLYGNGGGTFQTPVQYLVGDGQAAIEAVDVDRDGKLDLVTACTTTVRVLLNLGARKFAAPVSYTVGNTPYSAAPGDLNNDGWPDLVTSNNLSHNLCVLLNDKTGHFLPAVYYGAGSYPGKTTLADFNRDGNLDVVETNMVDGTASIYLGNGTGVLNKTYTYTLGSYPDLAAASDLNGDGILDLAVSDTFSHDLKVLFGNGNGSFVLDATYPGNTYPALIQAVDLDGDSRPDLAMANHGTGYFTVLQNQGGGLYSEPEKFSLNGVNVRTICVGDFDADGRPDIVISDEGTSKVSVFLNRALFPAPAAPSALIVTGVTSSYVNLGWQDNSYNEGHFVIERKTGGGNYAQVGTVLANTVYFTDSTVAAATSYTYRVKATNGVGGSAYSDPVSITTPAPPPPPPTAPTSLTALAVSLGEVDLAWQDKSSNEDSFILERKLGSGAFAPLAVVGANAIAYADTTVAGNSSYTYRVRAANSTGESANAVSPAVLTFPSTPSGLTATAISTTRIDLAWTDTNPNLASTKIERSLDGGQTYGPLATAAAGSFTYSHTGLTSGVTYYYRVRASNSTGNSPYSEAVGRAPLPSPPTAPSGLFVTPTSDTELKLIWQDNSTTETGFKVQIQDTDLSFRTLLTVDAGVTTYTYGNLTSNTNYVFRVRATNSGGDSNATEAVGLTLPSAPNSVAATPVSSSELQVSWKEPNVPPVSTVVERSTDGGGTFSPRATLPPGIVSMNDTGLTPATTYYYRLVKTNLAGNSAYSASVSATTHPAPPAAPTGLAVAATAPGVLRLTWTDQSSTETGFKIERQGPTGGFTAVTTLPADSSSYTDSSLPANASYTYRVRATNGGGESPAAEAGGLTLPAAPVGFTVDPAAQSRLVLSWSDGGTAPCATRVERSSDGGGSFTYLLTVPAGTHTYADTGLGVSATYTYRLQATNTSGLSPYTGPVEATTNPNLPGAPTNLAVTAVSQNQLRLDWSYAAGGETGFRIERLNGAAFATVADVAAGVHTYTQGGLAANTSYTYRVRTLNAGGASEPTSAVSGSTWPPAPAPPSDLHLTADSDAQITLTWTAAAGATQYRLERQTGGAPYATVATPGGSATTWSDTGLAEGTTYAYRLTALNAGGASTSVGGSAATYLKTPGNVRAVAWIRSVLVTWTDLSSRENLYQIFRESGSGQFVGVGTMPGNSSSWVDNTVVPGVTYFYRVRAVGPSNVSLPSADLPVTLQPDTPTAKLKVTPGALNFGSVKRNAKATLKLTVTNTGTGAGVVTVGPAPSPFLLAKGGGPFTVPAHGKVSISVTLPSTQAGRYTGVLPVSTTDPRLTHVTIKLSGTVK